MWQVVDINQPCPALALARRGLSLLRQPQPPLSRPFRPITAQRLAPTFAALAPHIPLRNSAPPLLPPLRPASSPDWLRPRPTETTRALSAFAEDLTGPTSQLASNLGQFSLELVDAGAADAAHPERLHFLFDPIDPLRSSARRLIVTQVSSLRWCAALLLRQFSSRPHTLRNPLHRRPSTRCCVSLRLVARSRVQAARSAEATPPCVGPDLFSDFGRGVCFIIPSASTQFTVLLRAPSRSS